MASCDYGQRDVVQLLLDNSERRNIDLNARSDLGKTALMFACMYGFKDVVQLFLDNSERNIDLNARCNIGMTAYNYWAVGHGREDVVKILEEHSKTKGVFLDKN